MTLKLGAFGNFLILASMGKKNYYFSREFVPLQQSAHLIKLFGRNKQKHFYDDETHYTIFGVVFIYKFDISFCCVLVIDIFIIT